MPDDTQHDCPGGCGTRVNRVLLACRLCWQRLPAMLRDRVNATYRRRTQDPRAHRDAVREASLWYRNNPAVDRG